MSSDLLHVYREQIGDQVVVHAVGEVDLATAPLLDQALRKATATPTTRWVVVNLTRVDFFGAVGLTVLLTAIRHGHATGVAVVVVTQPGQPAHRTITITELHRKLALIDSLDHALSNSR
jgi:anti-sigma B factor antagonist